MKLARYWSKESRKAQTSDGSEYDLSCWRGSNESVSDARELARRAVEALVAKVAAGEELEQYDYSEGYIREELIEELKSVDDEMIAIVTRNRYGALVLNTDRLLFADIDINPLGLFDKIKAFFGGAVKDRDYHRQQIRNFAAANSDLSLLVYETLAGLRLVVSNRSYSAVDSDAQALFEQLSCDPLYVKLCRAQSSFRARLTPKPWRIGYSRPPNNFPREERATQSAFHSWLKGYEQQSKGYAVCNMVEKIGSERATAEAERILQLHDRYTLGSTNQPLA